VNLRRLFGPEVLLRDAVVVSESLWWTLEMPLANIAEAKVEWTPLSVDRLVISSKAGNRISIPLVDTTDGLRSEIGIFLATAPQARWLSDGTRAALMLEKRHAD